MIKPIQSLMQFVFGARPNANGRGGTSDTRQTNRQRAQAYQIFISSTFIDLAAERKAVRDALFDLNMPLAAMGVSLVPVDLQGGADTQPPLDVCLQRLDACDLVVTLVGHRAGWLTPDGRSVTECEFDHAKENGIPRLAYLRDNMSLVLPEHVDKDDKHVAVLDRFKKKIDENVKRDTFRNPEHLRGHIFRDILFWLLNDPDIQIRLTQIHTPSSLPEIKRYLDAAKGNDIRKAVDVVTSRRFVLDMRRFGMQSIHRELLIDLLELGSLSPHTRVDDRYLRSRLLLQLLSEFPYSSLADGALVEAQKLEKSFGSPEYSFHVARAEATLHATCSRALPALKRMIRCAWATQDFHRIAEAMRTVADYHTHRGDHRRAKRWYWRSINTVCKMPDMCPHCLGLAFLGAAGEELNCHECQTTDDRLLKAYLIGRVIPDRSMQLRAMIKLSQHLAAHNKLDESVACAVISARIAKEIGPEHAEYSLPAILAETIAEHGHERVAETVVSVEKDADKILERLISRYKGSDFTKSLRLKSTAAGDHW